MRKETFVTYVELLV